MGLDDRLKEKEQQALLDRLMNEAGLYRSGRAWQETLAFIARLPHIAPFNAMLLQIQRPGLRFAATQELWQKRFRRTLKEDARPLIILWPKGPVAFLYDIDDTSGPPLPNDIASAFTAHGIVPKELLPHCCRRLQRLGITVEQHNWGDGQAGYIRISGRSVDEKKRERIEYLISLNKNHSPSVQVGTLLHEVAHLYLGHHGNNKRLGIAGREGLSHEEQEIEAESASWLLCQRLGLQTCAARYLSAFADGKTMPPVNAYTIIRAVGKIEAELKVLERVG
jgi:hypothetical protein